MKGFGWYIDPTGIKNNNILKSIAYLFQKKGKILIKVYQNGIKRSDTSPSQPTQAIDLTAAEICPGESAPSTRNYHIKDAL